MLDLPPQTGIEMLSCAGLFFGGTLSVLHQFAAANLPSFSSKLIVELLPPTRMPLVMVWS